MRRHRQLKIIVRLAACRLQFEDAVSIFLRCTCTMGRPKITAVMLIVYLGIIFDSTRRGVVTRPAPSRTASPPRPEAPFRDAPRRFSRRPRPRTRRAARAASRRSRPRSETRSVLRRRDSARAERSLWRRRRASTSERQQTAVPRDAAALPERQPLGHGKIDASLMKPGDTRQGLHHVRLAIHAAQNDVALRNRSLREPRIDPCDAREARRDVRRARDGEMRVI